MMSVSTLLSHSLSRTSDFAARHLREVLHVDEDKRDLEHVIDRLPVRAGTFERHVCDALRL
jgi:hypothetical protein